MKVCAFRFLIANFNCVHRTTGFFMKLFCTILFPFVVVVVVVDDDDDDDVVVVFVVVVLFCLLCCGFC